MINTPWTRLTCNQHFAPAFIVLFVGVALSAAVSVAIDMWRQNPAELLLVGLSVTVALAGLVQYLISRETRRVARVMLEALPQPVYFKGTDGRYAVVNSAWEAFFGVQRSAVVGHTTEELPARERDVTQRLDASDETLWQRPGFQVYEDVISTMHGARHDAIVCKATCIGAGGRIAGLVGTIIDISDRKRIERRLTMQHAVTRVLAEAENLNDVVPKIIRTICETMGWHYGAIYRYQAHEHVLRCEEMWGIDSPNIRRFMEAAGRRVVHVDEKGQGLVRRTFATGKPVWISDVALDETLQRKEMVVAAGLHGAFAFPLRAGNEVLGILEFFHSDVLDPDAMLLDVAESIGSQIGQYIVRRKAEAEKHLAMHDAVTGLPNRLLFMGRLDHAIVQARRHGRRLAVMFIDLDRFKLVNDTHGHEAGDLLLKAIAHRLKASLRAGDTAARLGGDEFVMLLEDITSESDMRGIGEKLIAELALPVGIGGTEVTVTASIGVSTFPRDGQDAAALLRCADAAMYRAKGGGRNLCALYSDRPPEHRELAELDAGAVEAGA
jgi:diguanylate cyclase (GGDEF)-like protein/PAS domain S-box-containing protein